MTGQQAGITKQSIAIIGGGPAGLMAAEYLSARAYVVTVYERKPSPARKFLMAGRGGLNLTHSEPLEAFVARYGAAADWMRPYVQHFTPAQLRAWCEGLGQETFIGTSGRIFPRAFKASPLLRAWQDRLEQAGVSFRLNHEWTGWDADGALTFVRDGAESVRVMPHATLLALGGASWPRLGTDGGWADILTRAGVSVAPLRPSNCGFVVDWSTVFRARFAGQPLKPVLLRYGDRSARGEIMVTEKGLEGGALYLLSAALRDGIAAQGEAVLHIDLRPDITLDDLARALSAPRGRLSFANVLRRQAGLDGAAAGLLRERRETDITTLPARDLAALIKAFPVTLTAPFSIDRAISSAGGIALTAVNGDLMLRHYPGVFVAGEMLDWEAPTGGYLLQGCFSTAVAAATGIDAYLQHGGGVLTAQKGQTDNA